MARVLTNNCTLQVNDETSVGTASTGATSWTVVEFDSIGAYGAQITTAVRRPISNNRGRAKGTTTDLDSTVEFDTDLTMDAFVRFADGFMYAEYANTEFNLRASSGTVPPPAVTAGGVFTIDAASATLAGKMQYGAATVQTLLFANGYANAVNNGLHVLAADVASTNTSVDVAAAVVDETPPTNATLEVCGIRTDDLTLTISGTTATLVSAADVDWTTTGIQVGQTIHVGSPDANGDVQNAYSSDSVYGYARVTAITATTLSLDKIDANFGSGGPHTPETIDVMFGRFLRNVLVTADATDNRYQELTYHFELAFPDLGGVGTDQYEYAAGNYGNEWTLNLPLTDKATMGFGFVGTTAEDITSSRKTDADTAVQPLRTTAFNTSSSLASLSTDLISSASDVCFKSLTLTLLNNATPEKCLGTLGAVFVNIGAFFADIEAQMAFTSAAIINAIKNNTTVTMSFILANENGAIAFDIPEMTVSGGGREFPVDQTVLVNLTGASFTSNAFGHDIGISLFPAVPGTLAQAA